ncbi:MAG: hypothetical protein ACI9YO_001264, partial [Gammaproteobacteria bacterium]
MFHLDVQDQQKPSSGWSHLINRLIYLPGVVIIFY